MMQVCRQTSQFLVLLCLPQIILPVQWQQETKEAESEQIKLRELNEWNLPHLHIRTTNTAKICMKRSLQSKKIIYFLLGF